MLAQLALTGALALNLSHSVPFYEHRAMLGVRYRVTAGGVRLRAGGMLAKINGLPFRQVIQTPDGRQPSGATFTHWAVGADVGTTVGRIGLAYLRAQWDLPRTATHQAIYYTAAAVTFEARTSWGLLRAERELAVLAQWRLASTRTVLRGTVRAGPWWGRGVATETSGTGWTGSAGVGWRVVGLEAGTEALPSVTGPGMVVNRFVRVVAAFQVGR